MCRVWFCSFHEDEVELLLCGIFNYKEQRRVNLGVSSVQMLGHFQHLQITFEKFCFEVPLQDFNEGLLKNHLIVAK